MVLVSCLDPHHDFEIGLWLVTAWAGPAIVRWAVREERGQIYCAPEVLQITNRYNENDGVSKRVHELAFGIVICFGLGRSRSSSSWPGPPRAFRRRLTVSNVFLQFLLRSKFHVTSERGSRPPSPDRPTTRRACARASPFLSPVGSWLVSPSPAVHRRLAAPCVAWCCFCPYQTGAPHGSRAARSRWLATVPCQSANSREIYAQTVQ